MGLALHMQSHGLGALCVHCEPHCLQQAAADATTRLAAAAAAAAALGTTLSNSPGPGGRPAPVVFSVYSLHSTMGLASRPRAMAAVPAVPTSSVSAAARTATVRRAAARSGAARQPADAVGRLWKGSGNVAALQGGLSLCAEGCTSQRTLPLHIAAAARLRRGIVAHRLQAAGSLGPGSSRGWRPAPGGCCKWPASLLLAIRVM